jgi:hypothetical protein
MVQRPAAIGQAARSSIAVAVPSTGGPAAAAVAALGAETSAGAQTTTRANCTESRPARTMAAVMLRVRLMESSLKVHEAEEIALRSVNHCRTGLQPDPDKALRHG